MKQEKVQTWNLAIVTTTTKSLVLQQRRQNWSLLKRINNRCKYNLPFMYGIESHRELRLRYNYSISLEQ